MSFAPPTFGSITATVTNTSGLTAKCAYDTTGLVTHRDFTVIPGGSTNLTFTGFNMRVFMSHSGKNTLEAKAVKRWLIENGPSLEGEIFLDVDDLLPGQEWKEALQQASSRCTVRVWDGPAAWSRQLCDKLTQTMSHKHWDDWIAENIDYEPVCPGKTPQPETDPP